QVLAGECVGRGQRNRARERQLVRECERSIEPLIVEPEPHIMNAGGRPKACDNVIGVCPSGHEARVDEGTNLNVVKPGLRQSLDETNFVRGGNWSGLDLESLPWPLLLDLHFLRQVSHSSSPCSRQQPPAGPELVCASRHRMEVELPFRPIFI